MTGPFGWPGTGGTAGGGEEEKLNRAGALRAYPSALPGPPVVHTDRRCEGQGREWSARPGDGQACGPALAHGRRTDRAASRFLYPLGPALPFGPALPPGDAPRGTGNGAPQTDARVGVSHRLPQADVSGPPEGLVVIPPWGCLRPRGRGMTSSPGEHVNVRRSPGWRVSKIVFDTSNATSRLTCQTLTHFRRRRRLAV